MGFFLFGDGFFEMNEYFDIELSNETPATVFMKLRQLTPTFLLESIERGVDQSRYSFLGIGSSQSIQVRSGKRASTFYVGTYRDSALRGCLISVEKKGQK